MSGALAIEADATVPTHGEIFVIRNVVRCSGRQRSELEDGRSSHSQIGQLIGAHHIALFRAICLNADSVGFNRNALRCRAHLHLEVHTGAVAHLEQNVCLFRELES